jgi:TetR/AcrR family transcriptional regulator, transcriptional repressor for nem operon
MRYPAEETAAKHERILKEASRLFRERGFDGVGVAEIMQTADLTHGAFYAHFPSKDALVAEAGVAALGEIGRRVARAAETDSPLEAFVGRYLSEDHRDRPGNGCALAAFGSDMVRQPEAVREAFTEEFGRLVDTVASGLDWPDDADPRKSALQLISTLVGTMILSRAVTDRQLSREILSAAHEHLGGSKVQGAKPRGKKSK